MTSTASSSIQTANPVAPLPKAVRWLCSFQVMNGFNFTIVLGTPMVLTAKYLGAGETLIGAILAMTPFLSVLQIFAGRLADRWGYQRMMLAGSLPRYLALLLLVPLPLLHGKTIGGWTIPDALLLTLLTVLVFLYAAIRILTFVGWVPWLMQLIPEAQRGRYFGWDQTTVCSGMFVSLLASACFLGNDPGGVPPWKYAVLLGSAFIAFGLSIRFLKAVPCNQPDAEAGKENLSWQEFRGIARNVWAHAPFRRMVRWMIINNLAWGAYGGFTVVFMRDELKIGEGYILGISGVMMLGIIISSMLWGRFSDAFGSRPTMRLAGAGQLVVLSTWLLAAMGMISLSIPTLFLMNLGFGIITAAMTVPFLKLYMVSFPQEEKTVAITMNTAIASIFAGIAPLAWGIILESLKHQSAFASGWLRPFTIFFGVSMFLAILMQVALTRIKDPKAASTLEMLGLLMVDWPRQRLSGLVNSLFEPGAWKRPGK
jgi:MFS family permease